jgi:deazaflavin-dependent oxidoreductase (nitroreductase family)
MQWASYLNYLENFTMKDIFIKWFMKINRLLLRLSRGKIASKLGTQTILVLHTIGRKSGQDRAIPIAYFNYEGRYLIVASNWGKDSQADWYLNLRSDPRARLEIDGKHISVVAHEALREEYDLLWKFATEQHPPYVTYQKKTTRRIPIMVFEPVG